MNEPIRVERRQMLASSAALLTFVPGASLAARTLRRLGERQLSFDEFLALANPVARELVGDTTPEGQDRYLLALATIAVRVAEVPVPEMREQSSGGTFIGANDGGDPFTVLHWRMEPGKTIGDHAHSYGNVVTLLLEGDVRIRNHEVVGARDYASKEGFRVRRTCDQFLRAGGVNLVSLERNYTHGFVAGPNGARGLDLTTRIRDKQPSPSLVLGQQLDPALGIFEANWKI